MTRFYPFNMTGNAIQCTNLDPPLFCFLPQQVYQLLMGHPQSRTTLSEHIVSLPSCLLIQAADHGLNLSILH